MRRVVRSVSADRASTPQYALSTKCDRAGLNPLSYRFVDCAGDLLLPLAENLDLVYRVDVRTRSREQVHAPQTALVLG
jgi:hypothetical protein